MEIMQVKRRPQRQSVHFMKKPDILDTHTAVAASVYGKYKAETKDEQTTTVIASTASPFKFSRSVMDAIDPKYDTMEEFELDR